MLPCPENCSEDLHVQTRRSLVIEMMVHSLSRDVKIVSSIRLAC